MSRRPKQDRIISELEHVFATILGLMICCEPAKGVELVRRDVRENEHFFRGIFEVVRDVPGRAVQCLCIYLRLFVCFCARRGLGCLRMDAVVVDGPFSSASSFPPSKTCIPFPQTQTRQHRTPSLFSHSLPPPNTQ